MKNKEWKEIQLRFCRKFGGGIESYGEPDVNVMELLAFFKKEVDKIREQARERIIKEIEKLAVPVKGKHKGKTFCPQCEDQGYQYAVDDIIRLIKK